MLSINYKFVYCTMETEFHMFKQSEVLELLLATNYLVFSKDNIHLEWNKAIEN